MLATLVASAMLASCTPGAGTGDEDTATAPEPVSTDYFGYQVNESLVTTNAASRVGASVNAGVVAARLYPAAYVAGPSGQLIPNTDLVSAQSLPGPVPQVQYTISEDATYSDGHPVTCLDFQLAFAAGSLTDIFASHVPLMSQVTEVECSVGSKQFTVVFDEDTGGRWRHLFGAGTVLPAHAVAREAGVEEDALNTAINDRDYGVLSPVAEVWNDGFDLASFNPDLQVSSGPFTIQQIGEAGEVVLERNPHYPGDAANLEHLVVWPREADPVALSDADALRVADVPTSDPAWVNRDDLANPYSVEPVVGELTDSLRLADAGVLANQWNRRAFNACIDRPAVAQASSEAAGVEVPPVVLHTVPHNDPIHRQLDDIGQEFLEPDLDTASGLWGTTIRIGYQGPDARKAAMVEAIASSCEEAGITVVDASDEGSTLNDLGRIEVGQWGAEVPVDGTIDAFLGAVDPTSEYGTVTARLTATEELRSAEETMWEELPSLPLAAEPRTFVRDDNVSNVVVYSGLTGVGWNKDRWKTTTSEEPSATESNADAADPEGAENDQVQ